MLKRGAMISHCPQRRMGPPEILERHMNVTGRMKQAKKWALIRVRLRSQRRKPPKKLKQF